MRYLVVMHRRTKRAPTGKRNGSYRHGRYTAKALAAQRELQDWLQESRQCAASICDSSWKHIHRARLLNGTTA